MGDSTPLWQGMLACWAKLGSGQAGYHPLPCHMLDVAAVARALWRTALHRASRQRIAALLGIVDDAIAEAWVAFLAALHDLGKASPLFQDLDRSGPTPQRLDRYGLSLPRNIPDGDKWRHDTITAVTLRPILEEDFGLSRPTAGTLALLVAGHHGVIPREDHVSPAATGDHKWQALRRTIVNTLADVLGVPRNAPPQKPDTAIAATLAGFVSVADWIGSTTEFFEYAAPDPTSAPDIDLREHAGRAEGKARDALKRLGWDLWSPPSAPTSFRDLFPRISRPNPLQERTQEIVGDLQGPSLVIVEAPMGEGKTEAALFLADYWTASRGQRGVYFALPTQATSNQMFTRVRNFLGTRFSTDVNLMLLHGHADLSAEFALMRQLGDRYLLDLQGVQAEEQAAGGGESHVVAAEWFTRRKRGLLAPFGVGTVDQALLAVLRTPHVAVRLFGLADKTIIFDEVHAYDTYMSTLLERLLEWLAALGANVVLLSATLPRAKHRALVRAFRKGLGQTDGAPTPLPPYPRVSWASPDATGAAPVEASPRAHRMLRLMQLKDTPPAPEGAWELGERLRALLERGGCAAVVCNTVARAQEVYRRLKPYFPGEASDGESRLDLLHARFPYDERARREERVLRRFGKPADDGSDDRRPDCAVLVATQVIEQSLDLDFDLLVTELAPVDLVLQRAGRLHRHQRPGERPSAVREPTVVLLHGGEAPDGTPRFIAGSDVVYDPHVLLRSWLALRDRAAIMLPDDVEALVEQVYGDGVTCPDDAPGAVRDLWRATEQRWRNSEQNSATSAKHPLLPRPSFTGALWHLTEDVLDEDDPDKHKDFQARTRDTGPSVDVVCLHGAPDRPTLGPGGPPVDLKTRPTAEEARALLAHSVTITNQRLVSALLDIEAPSGWKRSPLLRRHRLLVFDDAGLCHVGSSTVRLDPELGLVVTHAAPEDDAP